MNLKERIEKLGLGPKTVESLTEGLIREAVAANALAPGVTRFHDAILTLCCKLLEERTDRELPKNPW